MIDNSLVYEADEEYQHIVCGAGLVGVLWALYLRRRSQSVAIFERNIDIREDLDWGGRSINMLIAKKALDALEQLEIKELVLNSAKPIKGTIFHFPDKTTMTIPFGNKSEEVIYCIQRKQLNRILLSIAEDNQIGVYFGYSFHSADLNDNKFIFQNQDGKISIRGTYLYGADGANSEVRKNMFKYNGGTTKAEWFDWHYKEMFMPSDENQMYQLDPEYIHYWPRGNQMLMGMPNPNGSFCLTLFLSAYGEKSFQTLNNEEKMKEFLMKNFPDIFDLIPNPTEQIFSNPVGILGTLFCSQWTFQNKCVLLGDAAHTLLPFYFQAMNSGYFDCKVLDICLDEHGFQEGFEKYFQFQKPHADTIGRMVIDHFFDLSKRVLDPKFLLTKKVQIELMKKFPTKFRSRQNIMYFGSEKYCQIQKLFENNIYILQQITKNIDSVQAIDYALAEKLISQNTCGKN